MADLNERIQVQVYARVGTGTAYAVGNTFDLWATGEDEGSVGEFIQLTPTLREEIPVKRQRFTIRYTIGISDIDWRAYIEDPDPTTDLRYQNFLAVLTDNLGERFKVESVRNLEDRRRFTELGVSSGFGYYDPVG